MKQKYEVSDIRSRITKGKTKSTDKPTVKESMERSIPSSRNQTNIDE
jgi:hypothetical protein